MAYSLLWRQTTDEGLKFSLQTVEDLKRKIFDIASSFPGEETPRVLFIGESGAGKSSFITSIISTFNGVITMTSTIGSRVGHEFNNSRRFFEYRIHEEDEAGRKLNLVFCDSRGISKDGQLGISKRAIPLIIEGRFRHGDKIQDDTNPTDNPVIAEREPIEPSCVVFLEKAVRTGDVHHSIKDKLDLARDLIREKGIPSCLVITHIDEVEPNLKIVLGSKKIEKRIKERAGEAGVTPNRVFVVKNYTDERRTHIRNDVLILRTLLSIVTDVKQRLRDRSVQEPLDLLTSSPVISSNPSTVPCHSTDLPKAMSDSSLRPNIIQPNPASRRIQRSESEIKQSRSGARSTGRNRNSTLENTGNESDLLYEEPIWRAEPHSSDEEEIHATRHQSQASIQRKKFVAEDCDHDLIRDIRPKSRMTQTEEPSAIFRSRSNGLYHSMDRSRAKHLQNISNRNLLLKHQRYAGDIHCEDYVRHKQDDTSDEEEGYTSPIRAAICYLMQD